MTALGHATGDRYSSDPLERAVPGTSTASIAHALKVTASDLRRFRTAGLSRDEAEDVCGRAGLDPAHVWEAWSDDDDIPTPAFAAAPDDVPAPAGTVWEEPPSRGRPRFEVADEVLAALRARPGEWLRLREYTGVTSAGTAKKKASERFGPGFEVRAARVPTGGSRLYVRFVGDVA